jgi:hypothetical protein
MNSAPLPRSTALLIWLGGAVLLWGLAGVGIRWLL